MTQASKTAYFPYTDWMQVTVRQPDGRVPEPGTWLLLTAGIALLVSRRKASRR